jgi:hypothetical protein
VTAAPRPSAWRHRLPVIVLSLGGFVVASILTLFHAARPVARSAIYAPRQAMKKMEQEEDSS